MQETRHNDPSPRWWQRLSGPIAGMAVVGILLAAAFGLDLGSESQRDVALVIGTITLYVLTPIVVLWLLVVVWKRFTRSRAQSQMRG